MPHDKAKYAVWYSKNRVAKTASARRYKDLNLHQATTFTGSDTGKSGFIGEATVQIDLTRRGWEVTVPVSHTAKHDLHVEIPKRGWLGVQVKVGVLNKNTGHLSICVPKGWACKSPILAVVHPPTGRIEYRRGKQALPPELK